MYKIVCLGDSITCEWESPTYVTYWQELCNQIFGSNQVKIINAGINGETSQDGFYRLDADVIAHQPDLVTIFFGHNDVHQHLSIQQFKLSLENILFKLKSIKHLWLITPNLIYPHPIANQYPPYIQTIHQLSSQYQLPLVNLWELFKSQDLNKIYTYRFDYNGLSGRDYLHPNEIGQRFITKCLMETFEKEYNQGI